MNPSGIDARLAAHQLCFHAIAKQQMLENVSLPSGLSAQDKAFALRLARALLRQHGALSHYVSGFLQQPMKESRFDIQLVLELMAVQLHLSEVPAHAAVDTSVNLAKHHFPKLSGLVNAIGKKMASDEGKKRWQGLNHAKLSTPSWLWQSWHHAYGKDKTQAMAEAHLQEPAIDVSTKTGESLRHDAGQQVTQIEGYEAGEWWVQDRAAAMPVKMLGEIAGLKVLDVCAAPGGKTMQLAAAGARVTALDIAEKRLERLAENLERTGLSAEIICADATQYRPKAPFDVVVLDAPCSATGTLRRHPEILYHRSAKDVKRLVSIQAELLARCRKWLKPGGRLLYITCSLQPEEGEKQVQQGFRVIDTLRTTPDEGHDGFFTAVIQG